MKKYIYRYEIGGGVFGIESPFEYEETEPYKSFKTEKELTADSIVYTVSEGETLPEPSGEFIFEDTNHRVYEDGENILVYIGFYLNGEKRSEEIALAIYKGASPRTEIILSKKANLPRNDIFVFKAMGIEHLVSRLGGTVFHSSSVLTEKGVILFTAPSGTGKSTQADLWNKNRGTPVLNGDNSVIRKTDGRYCFYGIPFSGSSGICVNKTAPIRAVVYLKQAKHNKAERISGVKAFRILAEGLRTDLWNKEDMNLSSDLLLDLIGNVPVILLECLPDSGAVDELEAYLDNI